MKNQPGEQIVESLTKIVDIEALIDHGEAEGLYLECKAPATPQLTRDQKSNLAKAVSGFSNTSGGVILWGVSTTKHDHSGLDILSQIEPIGNCKSFMHQVDRAIPTLTTPAITNAQSKILTRRAGDTKGVVVTYIPKMLGDPVQSNLDNMFYFRSGDEFTVAPFEMIKRLFAATKVPDLHALFDNRIVKLEPDGMWVVPIILRNESSAIASDIKVMVGIINPSACAEITSPDFKDVSAVNPGKTIFIRDVDGVIHRGLNHVAGRLHLKMKVVKRAKRLLRLEVKIFANNMRARYIQTSIQLAKKGFMVKSTNVRDLY